MRLPGVLSQSTLAAMDNFYRRALQAQRTSHTKAPTDELKGLRLSYDVRSKIEDKGVSARETIGEFVRVALAYAETVQAHRPHGREWKRLQKQAARLQRLKTEHQHWEALRRLQSPTPLSFVKLPNGEQVKLLDWGERPLFDTFTPAKASP